MVLKLKIPTQRIKLFDVSPTLNAFVVGVQQGKAYLYDLKSAIRNEEQIKHLAAKRNEPIV